VSKEISVKLFSGMSGVLSFRCQNECVHLTLCFVTNKSQLKKMCQMDSFRLVRYEMSAGMAGFGPENVLLQQRHGAAPGMFLVGELTADCMLELQVLMAATRWQQQLLSGRIDGR
ncbi:hypothetical protein GOODEAATRI_023293, partial [Goodea atripinnis]